MSELMSKMSELLKKKIAHWDKELIVVILIII